MEAALQLHRQTCVRQANICDRMAGEAAKDGLWAAEILLNGYADRYRREAIEASQALLVAHRVTQ